MMICRPLDSLGAQGAIREDSGDVLWSAVHKHDEVLYLKEPRTYCFLKTYFA